MLLSLFSQETCLCIQIDQVVQSFSQVIAAPRALLHLLPLLPPPESRCTSHQSGTVTSANTDSATMPPFLEVVQKKPCNAARFWFHDAEWAQTFTLPASGASSERHMETQMNEELTSNSSTKTLDWFYSTLVGFWDLLPVAFFFHSAHFKATADRNVCPHQRLLAAWWSNTLTLT